MKLAIKLYKKISGKKSHKISPPEKVDRLWHSHILNTKKYSIFCDEIGMKIQHSVISAKFVDIREGQLETCKMLYKKFFMKDCEIEIWKEDEIEVLVKSLDGKDGSFIVNPNSTILSLKQLYSEKSGVPVDMQRVLFGGKELRDHERMCDLGIGQKAIFHSVLKLRGC